jgi:hypothetical protein
MTSEPNNGMRAPDGGYSILIVAHPTFLVWRSRRRARPRSDPGDRGADMPLPLAGEGRAEERPKKGTAPMPSDAHSRLIRDQFTSQAAPFSTASPITDAGAIEMIEYAPIRRRSSQRTGLSPRLDPGGGSPLYSDASLGGGRT